jgi:opacity protein-like surface antigen
MMSQSRTLSVLVLILAVSAMGTNAGEPVSATVCDAGAGCNWELGADPMECGECCSCGPYGYISAIVGGSFMRGASGGFNTAGPHENFDDAIDDVFTAGGTVGLAMPRSFGTLRVEVEGRGRDQFRGETGSFPGPPTAAFFYDVRADDGWTVMTNAWLDYPVYGCLDIYAGGGLGAGGYNLSVDDTVVTGADRVTEFAWQIGGGVNYRLHERLVLDVGYRYVDLGEADIPLEFLGAPAGNYTLDLTAHEVLLQLRLEEPFAFLRR